MKRLFMAVALFAYLWPSTAQAQRGNPDCPRRILWVYAPLEICLETVVEGLDAPGIVAIGGIAITADGTLYFARPALAAIWRMRPDGSGYFHTPEPFAVDLPEAPLGLIYDGPTRSWYASADTMIVQLRDDDGNGQADPPRVIVRDLPGGRGGWMSDLRIGADRRLYVAKGAECDTCLSDDPRRAALLSFALDGSDPQLVAGGLRDSFGFDWGPDGTLYVVDHERPGMPAELNAVPAGARGLDFGFPYCDPARQPVPGIAGASAEYCQRTTPPILTFDPGSHPTGALYFTGATLGRWFPSNSLVIAFAGSWNSPALAGYEVKVVSFSPQGSIIAVERPIPLSERTTSDASIIKTTFHPYNLVAVASSPEGWIYISAAQGLIYRLRPVGVLDKP